MREIQAIRIEVYPEHNWNKQSIVTFAVSMRVAGMPEVHAIMAYQLDHFADENIFWHIWNGIGRMLNEEVSRQTGSVVPQSDLPATA